MKTNPVIECILSHKSIRNFSDQNPDQETVETIVRAGQQAPFAGQSYSILLRRNRSKNPWKAPLFFIVCWDKHKFELIMNERGWTNLSSDLNSFMMGMQDVCYVSQNMVIAGRSLGLGSCFIGTALGRADKISEEFKLPSRVLPLVQFAMGYPIEEPPVRPRYPLEFSLIEEKYPDMDKDMIHRAMKEMDDGYLAQDYYRKANAKIPLIGDREEKFTYDNYSWTEHICRKMGQRRSDPEKLLKTFKRRGFNLLKKGE